jgi:hypothetical protein
MIDLSLRVPLSWFLLSATVAGTSWRADATVQHRADVEQNAPCADQPRSFAALRRAFNAAKRPSVEEMRGTWIAIGMFGDARSHGKEFILVDCNGITTDGHFAQAMQIAADIVVPYFVGTDTAERTITFGKGSVTFPIDFGGDASPVYRCRLSARNTLICLIGVYLEANEFKKMTVPSDKLYRPE